jgi:hypothetical protein
MSRRMLAWFLGVSAVLHIGVLLVSFLQTPEGKFSFPTIIGIWMIIYLMSNFMIFVLSALVLRGRRMSVTTDVSVGVVLAVVSVLCSVYVIPLRLLDLI